MTVLPKSIFMNSTLPFHLNVKFLQLQKWQATIVTMIEAEKRQQKRIGAALWEEEKKNHQPPRLGESATN